MHLYLDASALTKLIIDEPQGPALQRTVQDRSIVSSRIVVVEVVKAVTRASPDADPSEILAMTTLLEFDATVATLAATTGGPSLRSLDAIHIATALQLGAELESFITYDIRQAEAARAAGLHVLAPGGT